MANDLLDSFGLGNLAGDFVGIAEYVVWGVVIALVLGYAWLKYQDWKIYIYKVRIFKRRANGLVKETNTFGGYLNKNGQPIFQIKQGRFKKKELPRLPDSNLMDEEDRLYYYQLSPDSPLIQCSRHFNIEQVLVPNEQYVEPNGLEREELINQFYTELKVEQPDEKEDKLKLLALDRLNKKIEEEKNQLIDITEVYYSPIPTDQKLQALMDIKRLNQTLGVDVNKQFLYFVAGVIGLCIVGAIIFYIAVNKGSLPILEIVPILPLFSKKYIKFK